MAERGETATSPSCCRGRRLRVSVVGSSVRVSARAPMEAGCALAMPTRIVNWVERIPVPSRAKSKSLVTAREVRRKLNEAQKPVPERLSLLSKTAPPRLTCIYRSGYNYCQQIVKRCKFQVLVETLARVEEYEQHATSVSKGDAQRAAAGSHAGERFAASGRFWRVSRRSALFCSAPFRDTPLKGTPRVEYEC
jgi:hypothetical protein